MDLSLSISHYYITSLDSGIRPIYGHVNQFFVSVSKHLRYRTDENRLNLGHICFRGFSPGSVCSTDLGPVVGRTQEWKPAAEELFT